VDVREKIAKTSRSIAEEKGVVKIVRKSDFLLW